MEEESDVKIRSSRACGDRDEEDSEQVAICLWFSALMKKRCFALGKI